MTRYFVSSQLWLIVSLILLLGRTYERSDPLQYSWFHAAWFDPLEYRLLVLGALALALFFALMTFLTRRSSSEVHDAGTTAGGERE